VQLDAARRLTGDLSKASDWRRRNADAPANRRSARLQDLLRRLGALARAAADGDRGGAQESSRAVLMAAEQALRTDPDSPALRQASADQQRAAGEWASVEAAQRADAIRAAAARIAEEAQRAMASAAPPLSIAPALRGAFADALRRRGAAQ
jgi:hypothetical protein